MCVGTQACGILYPYVFRALCISCWVAHSAKGQDVECVAVDPSVDVLAFWDEYAAHMVDTPAAVVSYETFPGLPLIDSAKTRRERGDASNSKLGYPAALVEAAKESYDQVQVLHLGSVLESKFEVVRQSGVSDIRVRGYRSTHCVVHYFCVCLS
jgi:hypothetical protein